MAARKTIYMKDGAEGIWERAAELAGESLSSLIDRLLREYVGRKESVMIGTDGYIVFKFQEEDQPVVTKRFQGRWLIREFVSDDESRLYWDVALTQMERLAVMANGRDELTSYFEVFDSVEDMGIGGLVPQDLVSAAANEIGESYIQDLDI